MESLDYHYFPSPQSSFLYYNFGADSILLNDDFEATPSLEEVDSASFPLGPYHFEPALMSGFTSPPETTGSLSPPAQQFHPYPVASVNSRISLDLDPDLHHHRRRRSSSSEEKEPLTPAQCRRKAQNRAAQRAFRERKERHVRDLEAKLSHLTSTTNTLQTENTRLTSLLQRARTENELLRATVSRTSSPLAPAPTSASVAAIPSPRSLPKQQLQQRRRQCPRTPGLSTGPAWELLRSHSRGVAGAGGVVMGGEKLAEGERGGGDGIGV